MDIVGTIESAEGVHTIDVWYSARRHCWMVERRDAEGNVLGGTVQLPEEDDVAACVAEWLRAHSETHLVGRGAPAGAAVANRAA